MPWRIQSQRASEQWSKPLHHSIEILVFLVRDSPWMILIPKTSSIVGNLITRGRSLSHPHSYCSEGCETVTILSVDWSGKIINRTNGPPPGKDTNPLADLVSDQSIYSQSWAALRGVSPQFYQTDALAPVKLQGKTLIQKLDKCSSQADSRS